MENYESVILVKNEVFVFKIPPRTTNRGYRAADWNLDAPQWTGRMRLLAKGNELILKLEDKTSGELFAKSIIEIYPGAAIESVTDSSRYFVIRIQNDNGRTAYIGLGFGDRSDSFDFNVALQDHFKWVKKQQDNSQDSLSNDLNLGFKEGETIKINMNIVKKDGNDGVKKSRSYGNSTGGLLPPPSSARLPPPPTTNQPVSAKSTPSSAVTKDDEGQKNWVKF